MQYSIPVINARLDAVESTIGASPKLRFYTGARPANCAAAETGTLIAEIVLPADWMAQASAGTKAKSGTWTGIAVAAGTIGHYRIYDNAAAVCGNQGTASDTGSPDMTLDNATAAVGQTITVNTFTLTGGNT